MMKKTDELHLIYKGKNSLVYHQQESEYGVPVVIKMFPDELPNVQQLSYFKNEYEVSKELGIEGVRRTFGQTEVDGKTALVLEYVEGITWKKLFSQQAYNLEHFLQIAIELSQTLGEIHQHNIIHRDINTNNILINPETGQTTIIDFGISSRINAKMPHLSNPDVLEGTLSYISPEQTGRMNRVVDYRTDLYSLGIAFYEALTRKLPFTGKNSMELVHAHIAKKPASPQTHNPAIPDTLAAIVLCLIEKNAEERYQSAFGLKYDLEKCLQQWQKHQKIENFELGQEDYSGTFHLVEKLYGREEEIKTLLNIYDRIAQGGKELMLVGGYSGVGKSALVHEVHKPITQNNGNFVSGKYDQFNRDVPYSAIINSFEEFCETLLTLKDEVLEDWRTIIQQAVGNQGKVLTDMIPNLELIIGKQPDIREVGPQEAQSRFNAVVQSFVMSISTKDHPLVMFIDDLQWADPASLSLLYGLMTDQRNQYFLLICAYRDNEVSPVHPFIVMVEDIKRKKVSVNSILLNNLTLEQVNHLVSDALNSALPEAQKLSELLHEKTLGNAFFTTQALKAIYEEGLLHFDFANKQWVWDVAQIKGRNISDNVVELMSSKIVKLSKETQKALRLAACIGNHFDLKMLSVIYEQSFTITLQWLMEAATSGLIIPLDDNYRLYQNTLLAEVSANTKVNFKFIHDRVQQAAYSLIEEQKRKEVHLSIGRLLLSGTDESELDEYIFDIVGQLNQGIGLVSSEEEIITLIRLNLKAGFKAKASAAHEPALKYFTEAYQLLKDEMWQTHYDLVWEVYHEKAFSEYCCAHLEESEQILQIVLPKCKTENEKVKIYQIYIKVLFQLSRHDDSVAVSREALKFLGINLPKKVNKGHVIWEFMKFKRRLGKRKPIELIDLPVMTDQHLHNICAVINELVPSAYFTSSDLMAYISLIIANINVKHGNSVFGPFAYAMTSIVFSGVFKDFKTAYELSVMAIKLNEKYPELDVKARIHFLKGNFIVHWVRPIEEHLELNKIANQSAIDTGNLNWADYAFAFARTQSVFFNNHTLADIEKENVNYYHFHLRNKDREVILNQYFLLRYIRDFRGIREDAVENLYNYEPQAYEQEMLQPGNLTMRNYYWIFGMIKDYSQEHYQEALVKARKSAAIIHENLGSMLDFMQRFYFILVFLANDKKGGNFKTKLHYRLNKFLMKRYAKKCPENFLAHCYLVLAEENRFKRKNALAQGFYKQAIEEAEKRGFTQNIALCYELYAKYWLVRKEASAAKIYLRKAYRLYTSWGAIYKTKQLETAYPQLIEKSSVTNHQPTAEVTHLRPQVANGSTSTAGGSFLDLNSILKASQTLSQEVKIDGLVEKMLHIVIENTGAEKGYLIDKISGDLSIRAKGETTSAKVLEPLIPITESNEIPISLINYVVRSQQEIVLDDAFGSGKYDNDEYIQSQQPKSVLCYPVFRQEALTAIFYLENNLTSGAFTPARLEVLNTLSSQIAISIENALLYKNLEHKVQERTLKLDEALKEIRTANRQVMDSIYYAKRIQEAILVSHKQLQQAFNEHFVLYLPKDVVSGDFYWMSKLQQYIFVAVVDCTGHGVPGALMSMIGNTLLNELVNEQKIQEPHKVLELLHTGIRSVLKQTETENKDGMDVCLCRLEPKADDTIELVFTGAKRPVFYTHQVGEIQELRGDRQTIGGWQEGEQHQFTQQNITLPPGTILYLTSDGYVDTPNANRRSFSKKRLLKLLNVIQEKPMLEQGQILQQQLEKFQQGSKQRDDITIVGLKV